MKTNYSLETSLPAYHANTQGKQAQAMMILQLCYTLPVITIKHLAQLTGLPDSTVSGRVNDLIEEGKLRYSDDKVKYLGYTRKRIEVVKRQMEMFR